MKIKLDKTDSKVVKSNETYDIVFLSIYVSLFSYNFVFLFFIITNSFACFSGGSCI